MPDRVVLIAVPAVGEAAVVAVVGAMIERDPAVTRVAAWEPIVVAIAVPVTHSAAATFAVAVLIIAVVGAPAAPPFAVTVFVIAVVPTAAASTLVGLQVHRRAG